MLFNSRGPPEPGPPPRPPLWPAHPMKAPPHPPTLARPRRAMIPSTYVSRSSALVSRLMRSSAAIIRVSFTVSCGRVVEGGCAGDQMHVQARTLGAVIQQQPQRCNQPHAQNMAFPGAVAAPVLCPRLRIEQIVLLHKAGPQLGGLQRHAVGGDVALRRVGKCPGRTPWLEGGGSSWAEQATAALQHFVQSPVKSCTLRQRACLPSPAPLSTMPHLQVDVLGERHLAGQRAQQRRLALHNLQAGGGAPIRDASGRPLPSHRPCMHGCGLLPAAAQRHDAGHP